MNIIGIQSLLNAINVQSAPQIPTSAQTLASLISRLEISEPTLLAAKVLSSGLISSDINSEELPDKILKILAPNTNATDALATNKRLSEPLTSAVPAPLQWAKLQIAQSSPILVITREIPTPLQAGHNIPVILTAEGKLTFTPALTPILAGQQPSTPEKSNVEQPNTLLSTTKNENNLLLRATPNRPASLTNPEPQPIPSARLNNALAVIRPASLAAIDTLIQTLTKAQTSAMSAPTQLFVSLAQLNKAIKTLAPSIQQQLIPPKIQLSLDKIPLLPSSQDFEKNLQECLKPATVDATTAALQGIVTLLNRITNSEKAAPLAHAKGIFDLIANLPSSAAKHEHIQQSRIAIAKWLAGELNNTITQRALTTAGTLNQQIDKPDTLFLQQDVPLKWGEATANLHIAIEERREHEEHRDKNKTKVRATQNQWAVTMTLELANNKTLDVDIKLIEENITIGLWSNDTQLLATINRNIDDLKTNLQDAGLTIKELECHQGLPPKRRKQALSQTLIDVMT